MKQYDKMYAFLCINTCRCPQPYYIIVPEALMLPYASATVNA
jgi:hypothetical protein